MFPLRWDFNFLTFLMANDRDGDNGADFSPSTSALPCQYYSISVPDMVLLPE